MVSRGNGYGSNGAMPGIRAKLAVIQRGEQEHVKQQDRTADRRTRDPVRQLLGSRSRGSYVTLPALDNFNVFVECGRLLPHLLRRRRVLEPPTSCVYPLSPSFDD